MRSGFDLSNRCYPAPGRRVRSRILCLALRLGTAAFICLGTAIGRESPAKIDFDRDIRPILSENCFKCHGPDDGSRKARLRFDIRADALKPAKSGLLPIVPGAPEKSELIARITAKDPDDRMPPAQSGKSLSAAQVEALRGWIAQGAPYAVHWAYVEPQRPPIPEVRNRRWPQNTVDRFILARLEHERLSPSPEADRYTLIRRVSLDLTGLPPTPEEVAQYLANRSPRAYEALVDRLLNKEAFGEHWARMWLDLARYADSAGYADDPPRTIWAYRDYVIRSFNANKPFDQFTTEQIAGDLLPDANEEDRVATAFHRNTMTNNEGGTDDEEFRNAAVVDRINTTMAVWMATSLACAQCHNHKYDPISQKDYFRFFAIFNNTEDADRPDEAPVLDVFTPAQKAQRAAWQDESERIERQFETVTPQSLAGLDAWERDFPAESHWSRLEPAPPGRPSRFASNTDALNPVNGQTNWASYTLDFPLPVQRLAGLRLRAVAGHSTYEVGSPGGTNSCWMITNISARLVPPAFSSIIGRYVRVELPGKARILSLAEVQVFSGNKNVGLHGKASQSSTAYEGQARLAIDGNTNGDFEAAKSTTHTETSDDPWWELDLGTAQPLERIAVWNRTDGGLYTRLSDFRLTVLDEQHQAVWHLFVKDPPNPSATFALDGSQSIEFAAGSPKIVQPDSRSRHRTPAATTTNWGLVASDGQPGVLTLLPAGTLSISPNSRLQLMFAASSGFSAGSIQTAVCEDEGLAKYARIPEPLLQTLSLAPSQRSEKQNAELLRYYREQIEPDLKPARDRLHTLARQLTELKPTTVPIMHELAGEKRRKTHIQFRGNFLALGEEVAEGVPAAFHPVAGVAQPNRLDVARWLMDPNNPLTARVIANRFWEQIFGLGIVRTSEDFGSQGDRPTNPELLDWLATDLVARKWDIKGFLKMIVTSAAYRQSSRVTPELLEHDPDNLLLARGPRFRMPAEVVRDQALAVSGLLSHKMYGPSVRPPRPSLGLSAAFGGSLDWKNSEGEDRYRRALYIEWRRTSPYPSMATFDAPNREVCTLRRSRSNTPLQALVTLNDPVYLEAAQGLARRMLQTPGSLPEKVRSGFELCLVRPPRPNELAHLIRFYEIARDDFAKAPDKAKLLATDPAAPAPPGIELVDLAASTAVANVLLNLDETLMRP